jgi:molecular chaperone HtpG
VADRVVLLTRKAGQDPATGVRWESDGQGDYTLETVELPERGTQVTLHLREEEDELLNGYRLRSIVRKFSDHINLPILMAPEAPPKEGEPTPPMETVNRASALWTRSKGEISEEEYTEFYKHVAHEFDEPLAYVHSRMEGKYEYILLLYIPAHAPFDLWNRESRHGIKLYVRRVFIMDDAEQLLPNYLRFVRGIVDSSDLPLNISREILQQSRVIETIRSGAVKKTLTLLKELASDKPDKYASFWKEFGPALKEGIAEDAANRDEIARLLRFASTATMSDAQDVSLETYVGRMNEGQDKIYFMVADTYAAAKNSPLLEVFKKKGVEVLLLSDPIDNWVVAHLHEFDGKQLQSVSRGEVDLGKLADEDEQAEHQKAVDDSKSVVERIKGALGDRVKDVRATTRLTTSPACLVVDEHGLDPSFVRLMKAAGQPVPAMQPILEVNPHHPLVKMMSEAGDQVRFDDWALLLFDQAVLSDGGQLEDPSAFVGRLNELLVGLGHND